MASEVDICNSALAYLGKSAIVSLNEESQTARTCKRFYADSRNAYLERHPWAFSTQVVPLTEITLPVGLANYYGFGYSYPARCLRFLALLDEVSKKARVFEIKNTPEDLGGDRRIIVSNVNPAFAEITVKVTDPLLFSSLFSEALGLLLAYKMAMALTRNFKVQQNAFKDFNTFHTAAIDSDAASQLLESPPLKWSESRKFTSFRSPDI